MDETHIYGIWFCGDGRTQDYMARLVIKSGVWVLEYRFRYYSRTSKDPFDGKDRKEWYELASKDASDDTRDKAVKAIGLVMKLIEAKFRSKSDFVLLDCRTDDFETLERKLAGKEWIHMIKIEVDPKEET